MFDDNRYLTNTSLTSRPIGQRGLSMLDDGQAVLGLQRTWAADHMRAQQSFQASATHFQAMRDNFTREP